MKFNNLTNSVFLIISFACLSGCTTTEKKQDRNEQLCFLKVTQGELVFTENDEVHTLIDSLVMNLNIKNDSVTGIVEWIPEQKDKIVGTLTGTIQDDVITAMYSSVANRIPTKQEKILKLDSDKIWIKAGAVELRDGIWVLKDKNAAFSESIPKTLCK